MDNVDPAAWANVGLQALEVVGAIIGFVGGIAALLFRRTFATRDDLVKYCNEHAQEHHALEQRLASGENRFVALSGAIEMVKAAAEQARDAAKSAHDAVDRMGSLDVDIADLRGSIKAVQASLAPIERLTMGMVEGHMAENRATKTTRTR